MEDFEFDSIYYSGFDDFDEFDKEFLSKAEAAMVLQIYNNMGQVEDIRVGYESIKKFINGLSDE